MEPKSWTYKHFQINEGMKPGSKFFRYFFSVSEGNQKKCRYCVWIDDDALARFDPSEDFNTIVSSHSTQWEDWVKGKIDELDFRNLVLRYDANGEAEIDLDEMQEELT